MPSLKAQKSHAFHKSIRASLFDRIISFLLAFPALWLLSDMFLSEYLKLDDDNTELAFNVGSSSTTCATQRQSLSPT